jgi:hypothetical protein
MSTKLAPDSYDGTLLSWADVEQAEEWDALVLGNGMSINLWGDFKYRSLYERAKEHRFLSKKDRRLFEKLGITNFEEVLRKLSDAIVIGDAIGEERSTERALHESIQKALAQAVQAVHVEQGEIPLEHLEAIRAELRNYRHVFTTSYDLIVYWASGKGPEGWRYDGFCDFLWANDTNAFDESTITLPATSSRTRLYYLHGALHLVVLGDGTTCKNKASFLGLLDKFGRPFQGDHTARPLIVTEASASDKLRSINASDYLSYCWRMLGETNCPVVIFGHSLSDQDRHLVDAVNEHDERPIAISITGGSKKRIASEQHRIASVLHTRELYFFKASTHPLGAKEFRLNERPKMVFWRGKRLGRVA